MLKHSDRAVVPQVVIAVGYFGGSTAPVFLGQIGQIFGRVVDQRVVTFSQEELPHNHPHAGGGVALRHLVLVSGAAVFTRCPGAEQPSDRRDAFFANGDTSLQGTFYGQDLPRGHRRIARPV